jgi:ATP-dependent DNA ligase
LPFAAEFKYDGQRAQVHAFLPTASSCIGMSSTVQPIVKIFSRHLEDMTEKYPDVVALVREYFPPVGAMPPPELAGNTDVDNSPLSSLILDAEIVAWDTDGDTTKSFQELSNRARKDVQLADVTLPVCLFVFDLMYLNSKVSYHPHPLTNLA